MLHLNLPVCHSCDQREQPCATNCRCMANGRRYVDNARAHHCPLGKFCDRGVGDTLKRALDATGIGPLVKGVIEGVTGKPCGCPERQASLNAILPYDDPPRD